MAQKGSAFVGKWIVDTTKTENYDAFADASGLTDELREMCRDAGGCAEFIDNGDNTWTCKYKVDIEPEEKVITFTPGVELTSEFMGKGVKFTMNFESANKMTEVESSEFTNWTEVKITRVVNGDVMNIENKVKDAVMKTVMNRVK